MKLSTMVAKMRFKFHANAVDWNDVLNQLNIISDDKAEAKIKDHVMTIVNDILPRLGYDAEKLLGYDVEKFFKK